MAFGDMREWINKLEEEGELKRIKTEVNWDLELGAIARRALAERAPALLFENITGYSNTPSRRVFVGGVGSRARMALMLGLPKDTRFGEMVKVVRSRLKEPVKPKRVARGPVKENIIKGKNVNLFDFPVPRWHPLDGGRYINTFCGAVTKDPETGETNIGLYRGMISDKNKISVMLVPSQGWGIHWQKYKEMGKPMPIAIVYGWDDVLPFIAAAPVAESEYDLMGGIRQSPVELVKCETSDIEVPASAEIVVEGTVPTDLASFETEGPFGEWSGYFSGEPRKRPAVKVDCIMHRNDAIFRGQMEGAARGVMTEPAYMAFALHPALVWNILSSQGVPGILDVVVTPITIVKIHKTYRGQAKHVAAAIWGSRLSLGYCKIIMVVEEDVDIYNPRDFQLAMLWKLDPKKGIFVFPDFPGDVIDPSVPPEAKDELKYGTGRSHKLLIDATADWEAYPEREEWGGKRFPPRCTDMPAEIEQLINSKWTQYGF